MCSERSVVISASACAVTIICKRMLPSGVHRVQSAILDPTIKLVNRELRVSVSVLVYFYAKKVVQMAYKLDATSRVIQRKSLFVVINLRRLSLPVVRYKAQRTTSSFGFCC